MCGKLVPSLNDYRGQDLIGFYVFAITLAYIAVAMRFISTKISGAKYRLDDYLVIVALVRHSWPPNLLLPLSCRVPPNHSIF